MRFGRRLHFACSPENLCSARRKIAVFSDPDRVVVGVRSVAARRVIRGAARADHDADRNDVV